MIIAYVLSVLGMLSFQWGVRNELGGTGKFVGIILLLVALWKTGKSLGWFKADKKQLLICLVGHILIWIVGAFLYKYIVGVITFIGVLIGLAFFDDFFKSSEESSSQSESGTEGGLEDLPNIMFDNNNVRWQLQHRNYDHVVYCNDHGNTMIVRNANVCRGNIHTDQGSFHSY